MEHHVVMEKRCSCAKREGVPQIKRFRTKTEALAGAQAQLAYIRNCFCGKHDFDIVEVNDHYVIGMLDGCDCGTSGE
jgi:hypothetical protein